MKDKSGLPWGCIVQPFVEPNQGSIEICSTTAGKIARCSDCFAYINPLVKFSKFGWQCSLCYCYNNLTQRYKSCDPRNLPEIAQKYIEYEIGEEDEDDPPQPVFIALVDVTGSPEALSLIREGLQGALKALPPSSLFGLISFSDRIGVYDLKSPIPHVKHITIPETGACSLGLEEIVPLSNFLVEIETYQEHISSAVESLNSNVDISSSFIEDHNTQETKRGFGSAIKSVVDFLELFENNISNVYLMSFLCGVPNYGIGALEGHNSDSYSLNPLSPETDAYTTEAKRAAVCGTCIDLFVVTNQYVGLSSIKFLSLITGGNIMTYSDLSNATLPQDIYRQFSRPQTSHGLLRIRTSEEFKVSTGYGHFYPDSGYENLYHVQGCDQFKSFAFDFEFNDRDGFYDSKRSYGVIQMAYVYTYLPSLKEVENASGVRRKLRVSTVAVPVSQSTDNLYNTSNAKAILCLLCHKVIRSMLLGESEDGDGDLLIKDWFVYLLSRYNLILEKTEKQRPKQNVMQKVMGSNMQSNFDVSFSSRQNLHCLPHYIFALTKSTIFTKGEGMDADYITYLMCLYSGLSPNFLAKAIYPDLSSYGSPNKLSRSGLSLSHASLTNSDSNLFLLDAFTTIFLYTTVPEAKPSDPSVGDVDTSPAPKEKFVFPPRKGTVIRNTIDVLKHERHITAKYIVARKGSAEEQRLFDFLVEEGSGSGCSFDEFNHDILQQLTSLRKEGAF